MKPGANGEFVRVTSVDFFLPFVKRLAGIVPRAFIDASCKPLVIIASKRIPGLVDDWETVGREHGEVFGKLRPASTYVQVSRFIDPDWLVEIEADAVCQCQACRRRKSPLTS